MFKRIAHVGIAVKSLKEASQRFRDLLDAKESPSQSVSSENVNVAMFDIGGTKVELIESNDASSTIVKFIEKRGEGIHHISFEVDDLEKELARLRGKGFQVLEGYPRLGADGFQVAFLHPKTTNGVLIELSQKAR
ncbi:MAG: methylmalonyl-CoA epimerase [Bacteroidota bacterium]